MTIPINADADAASASDGIVFDPELGEDANASQNAVSGTREFANWICTANPFYAISALLMCVGLWVSFGSHADAAQTGGMIAGMTAYTALLAVTACLLVRQVKAWDDVRTVLLLVVLMFLATSVVFDEVLARNPSLGIWCYGAGLGFAILTSEGILRAIRLQLPTWYRLPYYLILTLFYVYPLALTPLMDQPSDTALAWALYGFGPAAGLTLLTLIPAIRRGGDYLRDNGSPWPWPLYPWSLFAFLIFAIGARSALLCWSMHHVGSAEREPYLFGPFFLAPLVLALGVLILEAAIKKGSEGGFALAFGMPLLAIALSAFGHRDETVYEWFLGRWQQIGGSPLYYSIWAAIGFYLYAEWRRVPDALSWLTAALIGLTFVGPETTRLAELDPLRPWPLLAIAALQGGLGLAQRHSSRIFAGLVCLALASGSIASETPFASYAIPIQFHALLLAALVIGGLFHDATAQVLRKLGPISGAAASLALMLAPLDSIQAIPIAARLSYPLVMAVVLAGYGFWLDHHRTSHQAAATIGIVWLGVFSWQGYAPLRSTVAGLDYIAGGMLFFAMAVFISFAKAGALPNWMRRFARWPSATSATAPTLKPAPVLSPIEEGIGESAQ